MKKKKLIIIAFILLLYSCTAYKEGMKKDDGFIEPACVENIKNIDTSFVG